MFAVPLIVNYEFSNSKLLVVPYARACVGILWPSLRLSFCFLSFLAHQCVTRVKGYTQTNHMYMPKTLARLHLQSWIQSHEAARAERLQRFDDRKHVWLIVQCCRADTEYMARHRHPRQTTMCCRTVPCFQALFYQCTVATQHTPSVSGEAIRPITRAQWYDVENSRSNGLSLS